MFFIAVIFAGLIFGSFATALIYRVPRDLPWVYGEKSWRSACTHCGEALRAKDLIPIYSWFALHGKCRDCGGKISPMYIGVELSVLALSVLTYIINGPTIETAFIILAIPFLVALMVIDLEHMILPNQLIAILSVLGLARAIERSV
ncbi:MAG: prepilin peptidase, partial [Alphaproteobacteria bacterium]